MEMEKTGTNQSLSQALVAATVSQACTEPGRPPAAARLSVPTTGILRTVTDFVPSTYIPSKLAISNKC